MCKGCERDGGLNQSRSKTGESTMVTEQEHGTIVWHNGKLVPWQDATIHVMSHVVNYGSSGFVGIRPYHTKPRPAGFETHPHIGVVCNPAHHPSLANSVFYQRVTELAVL